MQESPDDPWARLLSKDDYAPYGLVALVQEVDQHDQSTGRVLIVGVRDGTREEVSVDAAMLEAAIHQRLQENGKVLVAPRRAMLGRGCRLPSVTSWNSTINTHSPATQRCEQ